MECSKTTDLSGEVNYNIQCYREFPNIIRVSNQSPTASEQYIIQLFDSHLIIYWTGGVTANVVIVSSDAASISPRWFDYCYMQDGKGRHTICHQEISSIFSQCR